MKLPTAPWRDHPGLKAIINALNLGGDDVRFVGGSVRDTLAGAPVKDIDIATKLQPTDVIARLNAAGLKAVPTGIAHGTVTAVAPDCTVEVTTLRRDVATDGRHATIAFTDDWREDAARRDFTINALYADPTTGDVYDYFAGIDDLNAGIVRFIGAPLERIAEDHLRIMRFFRFHARYGKKDPDTDSLAACTQRANDLMALSRERVADELMKILALPDPTPTIALMIAHGIFVPVLPEIVSSDLLAQLVMQEMRANITSEPLRRLAALLPAKAEIAENIAARLKFSNASRKRLVSTSKRSADDLTTPHALAYRLGRDHAVDRLLLLGGDVASIVGWPIPTFPLSGGALIKRGLEPGPDVARILQAVEAHWIAEEFPDDARVGEIADDLVQSG